MIIPFHKSDAKLYIGFQGAILFYHGKSDQTSGNSSETYKKLWKTEKIREWAEKNRRNLEDKLNRCNWIITYVMLCLTIYYAVIILFSITGEYPVPFMGFGLSPIAGYWLAALLIPEGE